MAQHSQYRTVLPLPVTVFVADAMLLLTTVGQLGGGGAHLCPLPTGPGASMPALEGPQAITKQGGRDTPFSTPRLWDSMKP